MGLLDWVFGNSAQQAAGATPEQLATALGGTLQELEQCPREYTSFSIPKRSGGARILHAPNPQLKQMQRLLLRKLWPGLKPHPCATGFVKGHSILDNSLPHVGQTIVISVDLHEFFPSTSVAKVDNLYQRLGWNQAARKLLLGLTTHANGLPQGAPTSPLLSNLVNIRLDTRIATLIANMGGRYTRYADDITVSFATEPESVQRILHLLGLIIRDEGYRLNKGKTSVMRRHQRQVVTGLVVNERVRLPRPLRRKLRAIRHAAAIGRAPSLTPGQLAGWEAFEHMVAGAQELHVRARS